MIDYMIASIVGSAVFVVCWGTLVLLTMTVDEWIDKKREQKKKDN